ncbi:MAG: hypothetical protein NNA22_12375, partial [Nitrospira sp.]|nr:hypothetical protein [Nitrospira sp.]
MEPADIALVFGGGREMGFRPEEQGMKTSEGGFTKKLEAQGDGAQVMTYVGTAVVPMSVNGKTEMVPADVTASFSRPSPDAPWSGGVMTAHSTEGGEHRYALAGFEVDTRGMPDLSKGMTVTSSDGTELHTRHESEHGLVTTTTVGPDGNPVRNYNGIPEGGVWVIGPNGEEQHMSNVVLSGSGGVAVDGRGLPFTGHAFGDENGFRGEIDGTVQ